MKIAWGREKLKVKPCKSGRLRTKHKCNECGEFFVSNRTTARFCSDKCRVAYWRWLNAISK